MHHPRPWPALRALVVVACLLGLLSPARAQSPRQETLQSNAAATGNGTQASALGYSLAAVQIVGTGFTGTLSFEASVDGTTYTAVMCTSMANTTTTSTTATASGTWFCPMAGAQRFRARLSSYSAGSVTVLATFMPQVSRPTGQNGGAGSAAVGAAGTLQTSNGAAGLDAYAGVTCTNSVLTALDATGQGGCTQVAFGGIAAAAYTTDTTLAADSSSLLTTEHAVKTYVDSVAFTGLSWKGAVVAATTTAGTLASSFENGDTIDGVVLVTGDRLLIKDQAAPAANGVYTVAASGAPTRVTDIDTSSEFNGATVLVIGGTVNVSSVWTQTTVSPTVGTDPIVWAAVRSGTAYLAGSGLALTGNTFAVDSSVVRTTRTLTVAGTANEVTSSAGAQDLSANRTWTLSLPTALNLSSKKLQGASPLVFEGLSVDSFTTTLAVADPAANRTVTLPNETGTLCTTGSVCSGYQAAVTGSVVTGTGTQNVLPKWASGGTSLADSTLSDSGTLLTAAKPLRLNGATSGGVTLTAADATTAYTFKWPATQATADQCLHNDGLGNGSWSTCSYNTVQDEGSALTQRQILNFVGDGVACVDDGGGTRTTCTITGLAGGGITGSGTTGTIPLWSSSTALGDSLITVSSNAATLGYGLRYKTASKSSNFTFAVSDYTILCTAGSGGITGTLPAASGLTGQKYYLYKVDSAAGACTLAPNGSDTLNGVNASLATLTTQHAGLEVTWESSTGWVVVSLGPLAIGDTVSGGTAGSVLYVGTGPVLAQDNDNLFYTPPGDHILALGGYHSDFGQMTNGIVIADTHLSAQPSIGIGGLPNSGNDHIAELSFFSSAGDFTTPTSLGSESVPLGRVSFWQYAGSAYGRVAYIDSYNRGSGVGDLRLLVSGEVKSLIQFEGSAAVDISACTANGSTHCLAGQVEVQHKFLQSYAVTDAASTSKQADFFVDSARTTNESGTRTGARFHVLLEDDHNLATWYGMLVEGVYNGTHNVTSYIGLSVAPSMETSGTLGTVTALDISPFSSTTATTKTGIHIGDSGGATTAYGLLIDNISGTTAYSILAGTGIAKFGGNLIGPLQSTQTITAGATIAADSCGSVKLISSASAVTTSTSNTITAPASTNAACHMSICNTNASNAITLDSNSNIQLTGGADVVLGGGCCVDVVNTSSSGPWKQTSAQLCSS